MIHGKTPPVADVVRGSPTCASDCGLPLTRRIVTGVVRSPWYRNSKVPPIVRFEPLSGNVVNASTEVDVGLLDADVLEAGVTVVIRVVGIVVLGTLAVLVVLAYMGDAILWADKVEAPSVAVVVASLESVAGLEESTLKVYAVTL
jgi:hypothetical protein